jgi:hypothetical protein
MAYPPWPRVVTPVGYAESRLPSGVSPSVTPVTPYFYKGNGVGPVKGS